MYFLLGWGSRKPSYGHQQPCRAVLFTWLWSPGGHECSDNVGHGEGSWRWFCKRATPLNIFSCNKHWLRKTFYFLSFVIEDIFLALVSRGSWGHALKCLFSSLKKPHTSLTSLSKPLHSQGCKWKEWPRKLINKDLLFRNTSWIRQTQRGEQDDWWSLDRQWQAGPLLQIKEGEPRRKAQAARHKWIVRAESAKRARRWPDKIDSIFFIYDGFFIVLARIGSVELVL